MDLDHELADILNKLQVQSRPIIPLDTESLL